MNAERKIFELADTSASDIRGTGDTVYRLQPRIWLKELNEAAQKRLIAAPFAHQTVLQKGQKDVVIPKRRKFVGSGTTWGGVSLEGVDVSFTRVQNLSGVAVTPVRNNYAVAISNEVVRTTAIDMLKVLKEELIYVAGDSVDQSVFLAMNNDAQKAGSNFHGSQSIYGGDATQASEISTGDPITTDMVAEGKRKLQSSICQYRTYGTGESRSADTKNPWMNVPGAPFALFVAPEQEEVFLTDSQFVNASEYGSAKVINNGEIGEYLAVKIVVSNNVPGYNASATHADGRTTAVAQHRCPMIKGTKAVALAWGLKPRLHVVPYPTQLETRLIIEQSYKAEMLHPDAIVHINVSDS